MANCDDMCGFFTKNVNDLGNWTYNNVVKAYVNKYGPDPNIFFGKIYIDLQNIQKNASTKESVRRKAEELAMDWQVWTQPYKRYYKGEAKVQQLKVKDKIFTLQASMEAAQTNADGALKAGQLLKNHMEAAILKSTQTLKRVRNNDKTENPDPGEQEEEQDDTEEFDDGESEVVLNKRVRYDQSEKSGNISNGNNDGDAGQFALDLLLENHSEKQTTSPYDPTHSFILDLSPLSKIRANISREQWAILVSDKPAVARKMYDHEIESLIVHLFGKSDKGRLNNLQQAREAWYTLRSLPAPKYSDDFSYNEDEWKKIQRWVEHAVGRFLDAFESSRNPLQQNGCHEYEWFHGYIMPLFQGALALDGICYVPWGEISSLASQRRRNHNKDAHMEIVERGHMADMLCLYEQHELVCGLSCGGPHLHDLAKLSSDEFNLPRMMKDMLDDLQSKFHCAFKNGSRLYVLGVQTYMTEIRIYLMERREVYRLHLLKSFALPLAFPAYRNLRTALKWAWNVRGMVKALVQEFEKDSDDDDGVYTSVQEPLIMPTQDTPKKIPKKRGTKT